MSADYLILTAEQAARDWSGSDKGAELRPVMLADGRYVLPLAVRSAKEHAAHAEFLATLLPERLDDEAFAAAVTAPELQKMESEKAGAGK